MKAIVWCESAEKDIEERKYFPKQVCYARLNDEFVVESLEVKKIKPENDNNTPFDVRVNKYFGFIADKIKGDGVTDVYIKHDVEAAFITIPFYYADAESKNHYDYTIHVITAKAVDLICAKLILATKGTAKSNEKFIHSKTELTTIMNSVAEAVKNNNFRDLNKSYYGNLSSLNKDIPLDELFATRVGGKLFHTRSCESFHKYIKSGKCQYELYGFWDLMDKRPCSSCIKGGKFTTGGGREFDFTVMAEQAKADMEEKAAKMKQDQANREAEKARVKAERKAANDARRLANEQAKAEKEKAKAEAEAKAEQERLEAEQSAKEQERLEAEAKAEEERLAAEKAEQERLAAEKAEQERLEAERLEAERIVAEKAEQKRLEDERLEAERIEAERLEAERIEAERLEAERLEAERLEAERLEAEKAETDKVAAIKAAETAKRAKKFKENTDDKEAEATETPEKFDSTDTGIEVNTTVEIKYTGVDPLGVALLKICSKYGMYCELHKGGEIGIKTASGSWSFNYLTRPITLMHMNYDYKSNSAKFKQFHPQSNKFESPLDVVEYIIKHDNERINRLIGEYSL